MGTHKFLSTWIHIGSPSKFKAVLGHIFEILRDIYEKGNNSLNDALFFLDAI